MTSAHHHSCVIGIESLVQQLRPRWTLQASCRYPLGAAQCAHLWEVRRVTRDRQQYQPHLFSDLRCILDVFEGQWCHCMQVYAAWQCTCSGALPGMIAWWLRILPLLLLAGDCSGILQRTNLHTHPCRSDDAVLKNKRDSDECLSISTNVWRP